MSRFASPTRSARLTLETLERREVFSGGPWTPNLLHAGPADPVPAGTSSHGIIAILIGLRQNSSTAQPAAELTHDEAFENWANLVDRALDEAGQPTAFDRGYLTPWT